MCNVETLYKISKIFNLEEDEFHEHKEYLVFEYKSNFSKEFGTNPDIGWCGDAKNKQICFRSQLNKALSICTDAFIKNYKSLN